MNFLENKETWKKGAEKGIIKVIGISKSYHPDHVGGPINIIEVSRKRTKWYKKPPCY
jgi:hypothetical protein